MPEIAPAYRIVANREDITAVVRQRFVSLVVTDEAGVQSDRIALVLSDHDPQNVIALPATGAELEVWIGYDVAATRMGLFIADEIELSGPPNRLHIAAHAAPHDATPTGIAALQTQRTRSWEAGTTIEAMVKIIAEQHGLEPAVAAVLASIGLPHIDQTNESDINLLTRIARDYDAIAKPGGGRLVMAKRGQSQSISGKPLGQLNLTPADCSDWSVTLSTRPPAASVVAVYRDHASAADREITVGEGEPVRRLAHTYASQSAARNAAAAEKDQSTRAGATLRVTLPGNPAYSAEKRVLMSNFRAGIDGDWLITRVVHSLDGRGFATSIDAEIPANG